MWQPLCFVMKDRAKPGSSKPYAIRERLFLFACDVTEIMQKVHTPNRTLSELSAQLVAAAVSAAANAEEADDGSSRRDFLAKERICLRELKESRLRLRVLRRAKLLDERADALIRESHELVCIVATIIRNASRSAT
jgi:four helix bundle protein